MPYLLHQTIDQAAEHQPDHDAIRFGGEGPLVPEPISLSSTLRIGVTSAAVPEKNSSSAVLSSPRPMVASSWTV